MSEDRSKGDRLRELYKKTAATSLLILDDEVMNAYSDLPRGVKPVSEEPSTSKTNVRVA